MIETKGYLDSVVLEADVLRLDGWAATLDAGSIDKFNLTCGGKGLFNNEVTLGLPSPDVKSLHPALVDSDHCRFQIRARLNNGQRDSVRSSAITCTPVVDGREGRVLIHLIEPMLPTPSAEDILAIGCGFLEVSSEFLGYFIQMAGLRPGSDVLDVGCGCGRMSYMLAHYLDPAARYEGIDIVEHLIAWAQQTITPQFSNFTFQRADIYNKSYNPNGVFKASEYRFPYEDSSFDLIFLTSVFTHMLALDVRHYLDEFRRLLRPGGHCLTTCFLLNEESEALIREGKSTQNLVYPLNECYTADPSIPEGSIGFKDALLQRWITERGFTLRGKFYGSWCGRPSYTSYQDILAYTKPA